jgi:hypothetical protein
LIAGTALAIALLLGTAVAPSRAVPVPPGWALRTDATSRVTIVYPGEAAHLAPHIEREAVVFDARIRAILRTEPRGTFVVYLAPNRSALESVGRILPGAPEWASGYAFSASGMAVLRGDPRRGPLLVGMVPVLRHELVHLVLGEALPRRTHELPTWFSEGAAAYLAHEGSMRDLAVLARVALSQKPLGLEEMRYSFPREEGAARAAYVESYAFVTHMVGRHGETVLGEVLGEVRDGATFEEAFLTVTGRTVEDEEARWRRAFLWRYRWVPILTSGTTLWMGVLFLVFYAGYRRRRRSRETMARWEEEERRRLDPGERVM